MAKPWRFWFRYFPELGRFESKAAAANAWRMARNDLPRLALWAIAVPAGLAANALMFATAARLAKSLPSSPMLILFLSAVPGAALFGFASALAALIFARTVRRSLRRQLNALGKPTCMKCGYNLTGNISGICPECGTACPGATGVPNDDLRGPA